MNRKKAILMLSLVEMIILAVIAILFVEEFIPLKLFLALVILVGALSSTAVVIIIRKFNP